MARSADVPGPRERRPRRHLVICVAVLAAVTACGVVPGPVSPRSTSEPDAALTARLAEVPVVSLRGPRENPTLDPDVLAEFWDSAQVRAATPVSVAPGGGAAGLPVPAVPDGSVSAPGGAAPVRGMELFAAALLVRSPTGPFQDPVVPIIGSAASVGEIAEAPVFVGTGQRETLVARAAGRLFFTVDGQPRSCTAAAVVSSSGSVVATAGHCLLTDGADGDRAAATNVLFAPGYRDGEFPFGRWPVESVHLTEGWARGPVWGQDVAFVRVARSPTSGETLQNTLGALGVVFDPVTGLAGTPTALLGYPAVAPFDGAVLRWCATTSPAPATPVDAGGLGVRCDMTAGYSGGPMLSLFDPVTGGGFVTGIGSHDYGGGTVYGPRLGAEALAAYSEADQ